MSLSFFHGVHNNTSVRERQSSWMGEREEMDVVQSSVLVLRLLFVLTRGTAAAAAATAAAA